MSRQERLTALRERLSGIVSADEQLLLQELHQIVVRLESAGDRFEVTSVISHRTSRALLDVVWLGQLAQLEPVKAREVAWMLLEAAAVAEAEAHLFRFMTQAVLLEPDRAAAMLADFRRYRDEDQSSLVGHDRTS